MTAITASALVGMCGELFALDEYLPYIIFNKLGESNYIFIFNLSAVNTILKDHFNDSPTPAGSYLFFNFEVMEGDMEILKNIGQERMPNGYQQLFDFLSLHEGDRIGGFSIENEYAEQLILDLHNL